MASFSHEDTVEIARPPDTVFPWLVEPDRIRRWMRDLRDYRLDAEELCEGARSRGVMHSPLGDVRFTSELASYEPPTLAVSDAHGRGFHLVSRFDLREHAGSTRLTARIDLRLTGVLRFAGGAVKGRSQERLERDLRRLKEVVESDGAA
jgi:uncharacterized protein YndB with AHSA1/START domain